MIYGNWLHKALLRCIFQVEQCNELLCTKRQGWMKWIPVETARKFTLESVYTCSTEATASDQRSSVPSSWSSRKALWVYCLSTVSALLQLAHWQGSVCDSNFTSAFSVRVSWTKWHCFCMYSALLCVDSTSVLELLSFLLSCESLCHLSMFFVRHDSCCRIGKKTLCTM